MSVLFLFLLVFHFWNSPFCVPSRAAKTGLFLDDDDDDFLSQPVAKPAPKKAEPTPAPAPTPAVVEQTQAPEPAVAVAVPPSEEKKKPVGGVSVFGAVPPKGLFFFLFLSSISFYFFF